MSHGAQLKTRDEAVQFIQAGNAVFTLVSKKTGARFTYKVTESDDGKLFFVGVLTGPDNTSDYSYLGIIRAGVFMQTAKSRIWPGAPSYDAFAWFWKQLDKPALPDTLEVWHEGRCGRCGRPLTVPESIERGIGPECASKVGLGKLRETADTRAFQEAC